MGVAVASQRVNAYARNTTTPIVAFDDTDANGDWAIGPGEAGDAALTAAEDRDAYDVEIRNGADRIWWNADDEVQAKTLQLWNTDADEYALYVTRTEDAASVEVAVFEGDRATPADGDLAYISLRLSDSAGNQDEQARIGWSATTVLNGATQDGDLILSALVNGTITEMLRLDGSAGTVTISAPISAQVEVADDILFTLGNDNDGVLLNRSTILATNTALTGVMIGTPVTPAVAANSVIVSNVTASGDYLLALNVGGNSQAWAWVDSSAGIQTLYAAGVARILLNSTGGSFTGTWSDLGTVTTVDVNGGTLDGVVIGGASAAAATVTTLTTGGNTTLTGGDTFVSNTYGVVVGHTAQVATVQGVPELQVLGTAAADSTLVLGRWSADTGAGTLSLVKSRNATIGSFTIVANGDTVGQIVASIDDGVNYETRIAEIDFILDAVPSAGVGPGRILFYTASAAGSLTERLRINSSGLFLINDTASTFMTGPGLHIHGTQDDEHLTFANADVSHGFTAQAEANTFGTVRKENNTEGGFAIRGFNTGVTSATVALSFVGSHGGTPDTTDTSTSVSVVRIGGTKRSGTGDIALAATENILTVHDGASTRFLVKGNGDVHLTNTTLTALDDYPDALLMRAGRAAMAPVGSPLHDDFQHLIAQYAPVLEEKRIMFFERDSEGRITGAMNNVMASTMVAWDGLWQQQGWLRDIMSVLTPDQRAALPERTRQLLAAA